MMSDFTLKVYEDLCKAVRMIQTDCRFLNSLNRPQNTKIILRHDVDRKPRNALRIAQLEFRMNVRSTYYFRCVPASFDADIIRQISEMNHEIGFHYEVMRKAKGDIQIARKLFKQDIEQLRSICEIKTASMHGSPISAHNNIDFWKDDNLSNYSLEGEAYSNILTDLEYYTDTGGRWNGKDNNRDQIRRCIMPMVESTQDIILRIQKGSKAYISCHPERWAATPLEALNYRLKDAVFNLGKRAFR